MPKKSCPFSIGSILWKMDKTSWTPNRRFRWQIFRSQNIQQYGHIRHFGRKRNRVCVFILRRYFFYISNMLKFRFFSVCTYLLLAYHTVVDRIVGPATVELDRYVLLGCKLLHENWLPDRSHHCPLHSMVQVDVGHANVSRHIPSQKHLKINQLLFIYN